MNPEDVANFLERYTYDYLINQALDRVPEGIDIREGSIIYDALAPACYQLADFYMQLKQVAQDSFIHSAMGEYLDLKVAEFGLERFQATHALRIGLFETEEEQPFDVPIGSRFATIENEALIFTVVEREDLGRFILRANETGTKGNQYHGNVLPVDNINGLTRAILDEIATPAQNEETDDELRERFFNFINQKTFGGNFSDYVSLVNSVDGVGGQQIYPVWNGGGTVKVLILDAEWNPATQTFMNQVKEYLDPEQHTGVGQGQVPIGHKVTVGTAERKNIDVEFNLSLMTGYVLSQVQPYIDEVINNYFLELRQNWSVFSDLNEYFLSVYRSQILAGLIGIQGIANVENMKLDGQETDISLTLTAELSELPYVGSVTINES